MSMPNIPNITPVISLERCEVIDLLLSSIALEEIGLSNVLNAEAEKLHCFLETHPHCPEDYFKINNNVNKTLRTIVKSQMLLQFKLEDVLTLNEMSDCNQQRNHCDHSHKYNCHQQHTCCHVSKCDKCKPKKSDC